MRDGLVTRGGRKFNASRWNAVQSDVPGGDGGGLQLAVEN
jgi:hypothetical protein